MSDNKPDQQETHDIDFHQLLNEIDEDVRTKRASGELSTELERELDLVFARIAPAGAVAGNFEQLLERVEQQAHIDLVAPNESARPGVPHVKRVVQKSVRWYMRYVADQFTGFAHTLTKTLRLLSERTDALEELAVPYGEFAAIQAHQLQDPSALWQSEIVEALKGVNGRVLHARCRSGDLVRVLRDASVDAYGVDETAEFVAQGTASTPGSDLRADNERKHLRLLAPGALSGLVLTGCVDILPRGAQIELADLAADKVAPAGTVAMVITNPTAWEQTHAKVEVDLAPGRPMHAETWAHLLHERGFSSVEVRHGVSQESFVKVPGDDEATAAVNANFDQLGSLLFPPATSLLIAHR